MKDSLFYKIKNAPLIHIEDKAVNEKLKNKPFIRLLVDILDGDLWSSKVSFFGNTFIVFLILLSTFEIIFVTDPNFVDYVAFFKFIYISTSIIFSFEFLARILLAGYINPEYKGIQAKIKYLFSFYGLVDVLSITPFIFGLFGFNTSNYITVLRIFRVWRIARYIPSFSNISQAFNSKRNEILVTLLGVILLSLTVSTFIYYAELLNGTKDFKSIINVFLWSIGKYTGDYGAIATAAPLTLIGKILATINGLLGIALFAIPTGLLGSAFIDQLSAEKQKLAIDSKIKIINNQFEQSVGGKSILGNRKAYFRFFVFETIQSRFMFSDAEILECIREANNLRFRAMKSSVDIKYNDTKLIERYVKNQSYGCKIINEDSKIVIVNPVGEIERCISHFVYTIIDNLGYNYISREKRFSVNGVDVGVNSSIFFANYESYDTTNFPIEYKDFMFDLKNINKDDFVIVFSSGASGRGDFILEYGNKQGVEEITIGTSTIYNEELLNTFQNNLSQNSTINVKTAKATSEGFTFKIENHTIGNYDQTWIGKTIHRLTGANVLTVYININILIGDDPKYYSALSVLINTLEQTFGNNKKST